MLDSLEILEYSLNSPEAIQTNKTLFQFQISIQSKVWMLYGYYKLILKYCVQLLLTPVFTYGRKGRGKGRGHMVRVAGGRELDGGRAGDTQWSKSKSFVIHKGNG